MIYRMKYFLVCLFRPYFNGSNKCDCLAYIENSCFSGNNSFQKIRSRSLAIQKSNFIIRTFILLLDANQLEANRSTSIIRKQWHITTSPPQQRQCASWVHQIDISHWRGRVWFCLQRLRWCMLLSMVSRNLLVHLLQIMSCITVLLCGDYFLLEHNMHLV